MDDKVAETLRTSIVKRLKLAPGYVLVVQLDQEPTDNMIDNIHNTFRHLFPNNKTIICPKGMDIKIIAPEEKKQQMTTGYLKAKDRGEVE